MRYRTIVADPPWGYDGKASPWYSATDPHYPLMPLDEIRALPVSDLAAPDAHLYLWSVLPMMSEAYDVVKAWGFDASTLLTWCKPGVGLGGGWRGNTEHLIVARRGVFLPNPTCSLCGGRVRGAAKCACASPDWRFRGDPVVPGLRFLSEAQGTWYAAPRREHSAKPDVFLDLIERMSPPPRLELFARRQRLGWDTWGNEALQHVEMSAAKNSGHDLDTSTVSGLGE